MVPDPPVVSDTVSVDYSVDLRLVSDLTEVSLGEIVDLNPSLLRMTTPEDTDFDLHLPVGTRALFLKRIQAIPETKRTSWRFHVVRAGESLETVASSFHDRAAEIASANNLSQDASINAGDELVVPVSTAIAIPHPLRYVTRAGDTLVTVADRFNVSVEDLRRWNHLSTSSIRPQHTLYVAQPVHLAPATHVRSKKSHGAASAQPAVGATGRNAAVAAKSPARKSAGDPAVKSRKPRSKRKTASK
jgi:membrane-bound lytic murein transglycosylase D